jgi:hypothetical protein
MTRADVFITNVIHCQRRSDPVPRTWTVRLSSYGPR